MTNKKTMTVLPALVATFALMFVAVTPNVLAEPGGAYAAFKEGHNAYKMHKMPIQVEGFVGSIEITEDSDRATLREQVTVSLSEAAEGLDVQKAKLGAIVNENDDKYLVWKLVSIEKDLESETKTRTIYIVDAADADNTATVIKEFDHSMKDKRYNGSNTSPTTQFSEIKENRILDGILA